MGKQKALERRMATEQRERDERITRHVRLALDNLSTGLVEVERMRVESIGVVALVGGRVYSVGYGSGEALHAGYGAAQQHVQGLALRHLRVELPREDGGGKGEGNEQDAPSIDETTTPHADDCPCTRCEEGCEAEAAADNRPDGWLSTEAEREAAQAFDEGR